MEERKERKMNKGCRKKKQTNKKKSEANKQFRFSTRVAHQQTRAIEGT